MPDAPEAIMPVPTLGAPSAPGAVIAVPTLGTPTAPAAVMAVPTLGQGAASLTLGAGNGALVVTARATGTQGNAITVAVAAEAASPVAAAAVVDLAVTLTPGIVTSDCVLRGQYDPGDRNLYSTDAALDYSTAPNRCVVTTAGSQDMWYIMRWDAAGELVYSASKASADLSPLYLDNWTVAVGGAQPTISETYNGLSIVTRNSSATQFAAAIAASASVADLISAVAGGDGTGAVATAGAANLTGGYGPTAPTPIVS